MELPLAEFESMAVMVPVSVNAPLVLFGKAL